MTTYSLVPLTPDPYWVGYGPITTACTVSRQQGSNQRRLRSLGGYLIAGCQVGLCSSLGVGLDNALGQVSPQISGISPLRALSCASVLPISKSDWIEM